MACVHPRCRRGLSGLLEATEPGLKEQIVRSRFIASQQSRCENRDLAFLPRSLIELLRFPRA